ncbi:hypothetical protein ACNOYE_34395 [Nannocystaceae bacterium ST9]
MAKFPERRIAGCVCPECEGSGRPRDAEPPREAWVLLFDRCPTCEGSGAALEVPVDDLRQLAPHPRMVAPRSLITTGRFGVVGEIVDGVGARRTCMIDSTWRHVVVV